MNLAFLSIARVGHTFWRRCKVPHVPTPTERMQAWLATRPVIFANTHFSPPPPSKNPEPTAGRRLSFKESQA